MAATPLITQGAAQDAAPAHRIALVEEGVAAETEAVLPTLKMLEMIGSAGTSIPGNPGRQALLRYTDQPLSTPRVLPGRAAIAIAEHA